MKGLYRPLYDVCHINGRRKGKGLEVSCKYNFYYGSTKDPAFNRDLAYIFAIILFHPATKRDQVFIQDQL